MGEVNVVGEVVLDQLLAELALHERVRGDLPGEPSRTSFSAPHGEVEDAFHERYRQRVLAMARRIPAAIGSICGRIPWGDVGRVRHHGVILLPKDLADQVAVLCREQVRRRCVLLINPSDALLPRSRAMQQRVT